MNTHERLVALQDVIEARSRLLQDVAHELKNPLTVIHGYASFLMDEDMPALEQLRAAQAILAHAERAIAFVEQLQAAARLEVVNAPPAPRRVDVASLLQDAAEAAELEANRRGVRLSWRCPVDAPLEV